MPTSTLSLTPETPTTNVYTSQNRVNTWTYDNNGNILSIPIVPPNSMRNFTYDAENRQFTATITNSGATTSASYL